MYVHLYEMNQKIAVQLDHEIKLYIIFLNLTVIYISQTDDCLLACDCGSVKPKFMQLSLSAPTFPPD